MVKKSIIEDIFDSTSGTYDRERFAELHAESIALWRGPKRCAPVVRAPFTFSDLRRQDTLRGDVKRLLF